MKKILLCLLWLPSFVSSAQCDPALRPVIFVHGFLASGDTWSNAARYFRENGYCNDQLYAYDWNSVSGNGRSNEQALVQLIDRILTSTGASQVDLVGHSAGGGLVRGLLKDSTQAQKVGRYIHIGSRKWTSAYAWFPNEQCMNIYSSGDRVAGNGAGAVEGAVNVALTEEDHYQVATSSSALSAMHDFLIRDKKKTSENKSSKGLVSIDKITKTSVSIGGKAVLLGDNAPIKEATITIHAIDKKTGLRKRNNSGVQIKTEVTGQWGPVKLTSGIPYEIELAPADPSKKKISYFFHSFTYDDPLVYLRGIPEGSRMSALLGKIPQEKDQSALVLYSAAGAMIGGRDSVTVNNVPICSSTLTPASRTVITSFIFDDGDGVSTGQVLKQYASAPFIGGIDLLLPTAATKVIAVYFNGKTLNLPALPSSERLLLAVLK
ncbi:MAG: alpha/beta fold hydrolase [Sphingomonadales bacterium]